MGKRKLKGFSGLKKCSAGEVYVFKNGKAKMPGFYLHHQTTFISFKEFNELNKEGKQHGVFPRIAVCQTHS